MLPSFELTKTVQVAHPIHLKDQYKPGEFLWLPLNGNLYIDGTPSSRHPERPFHLVATNLHGKDVQFIHFEYPVRFTDSLHHNILHYSLFPVEIDHIPLKSRKVKLRIPASRWKKLKAQREQNKRDKEKMKQLYAQHTNGPIENECWVEPVQSKIVSLFGSPRTLPNGISYYHTGVDLRARTGTEIRVPASGTVLLSEHMVVPGNTVVIDHGAGILSRYMHLEESNVYPGQYIRRGEILGLAGATGRVEAAHLHWEVVWKGRKSNPHLFMTAWNQHCQI